MPNYKTGLQILGILLVLVGAHPMSGQILHASGPLPSFEVATIKPWKPTPLPMNAAVPTKVDATQGVRPRQTDRVDFIGQIDLLILDAYNLSIGSERRILKGPKWADSEEDRYEVQAKIDAATFAALQKMPLEQQHEQVALMEQALLAERFHLKVHFEMHGEAPVYALVVAQGGPKLAPAREEETTNLYFLKNEITARAVTLEQFVHSPFWTPIGDRFVVDQTGLAGRYDFRLKWRSNALDGADVPGAEDLPPLFDAIREQLGLKAIDAKAPLEVIVIEHIDRPSKN